MIRKILLILLLMILKENFILSFGPGWLSHRVISDKVHRLFVTLSYNGPARFVPFRSLITILI